LIPEGLKCDKEPSPVIFYRRNKKNMSKYRIYIDESGNPSLKSCNNENERFLSLTGVIIEIDYVNKFLHDDMENLKKRFFNYSYDDPIIFHRKEIMNKIDRFAILKDDKIRTQFNCELLNRLENWEYKVITVLIDKKEHRETYKIWKYDPYHYCLAILLERYLFILEDKQANGDVMIESRGGKEDGRLKESFIRVYEDGTNYVQAEKFHNLLTSKQLKVKPKKLNISGLQIADLIAQPSRNDLLIKLELIKENKDSFGNEIIKILRKGKYHRVSGKLFGYGLKKLP